MKSYKIFIGEIVQKQNGFHVLGRTKPWIGSTISYKVYSTQSIFEAFQSIVLHYCVGKRVLNLNCLTYKERLTISSIKLDIFCTNYL